MRFVFLVLFATQTFFSLHAFAQDNNIRIAQLTERPQRIEGSNNYSFIVDVGRCAALAEAVAVFGWYSQPILSGLGGSSEWGHVQLSALLKSEQTAKGIELIIVGVTGYNISNLANYTVGEFWDYFIAPQVDACKRVGFDYWEGIRSLPDLVSQPDFFTPHENDGVGIATGRVCASNNLGYTSYNFFGGGLSGCKKCCGSKLTNGNKLSTHLIACEAVCNAQFQ